MALPKVKYSTFTATIPSTGAKHTFRPFTVREEKVLLTALEGNDQAEIVQATSDVISACFNGAIDPAKLSTYDIEYLFLKIRAASVSDTVELFFRNEACELEGGNPCKKTIGIRIDLKDVKVQCLDTQGEYIEYEPSTIGLGKQIILEDGLGVTMKHPGIADIEAAESASDDYSRTVELTKRCITSVFDEETVSTGDDLVKSELDEWFNDLQSNQKQKLFDFVANIPKLRYETSFKCKTCGYEEPVVFEGLQSFFG